MGFKIISIREIPTWIKVLKADPEVKTNLDILQELTLIDDLLYIEKSFALLRKKKGLRDLLETRIGYELGHIDNLQ